MDEVLKNLILISMGTCIGAYFLIKIGRLWVSAYDSSPPLIKSGIHMIKIGVLIKWISVAVFIFAALSLLVINFV